MCLKNQCEAADCNRLAEDNGILNKGLFRLTIC